MLAGELEEQVTDESAPETRQPAHRPRGLRKELLEVPEFFTPRQTSAPAVPGSPEGLFACREKAQDLTGSRCLELQSGDPENEKNKDRFCATGECLQGARVRAVLERLKQVRICSACRRVQLSERNTDGLCRACRGDEPASPPPLPQLSTPYLALTPAPPPPAPPAERIQEKQPMPDENNCSVCGDPLRSDNTSGVHTRCKGAARKAGPPPVVHTSVWAKDLPDVTEAPVDWIIAAHREYLRRKEDAKRLLEADDASES